MACIKKAQVAFVMQIHFWKEEKNAEKVSGPLELMGTMGICPYLAYSPEQ